MASIRSMTRRDKERAGPATDGARRSMHACRLCGPIRGLLDTGRLVHVRRAPGRAAGKVLVKANRLGEARKGGQMAHRSDRRCDAEGAAEAAT